MAISITKYVDITSGVGGGTVVGQRSFVWRIFTTNVALAVNTLATCTTLAEVGTLFTTSSEEYARASFYFGWVSKNITQAPSIEFYGWDEVNDSLTVCLTKSAQLSNNFGSLSFTDSSALTLTQVEEIATWNAAQNVMYIYSQIVSSVNASAWSSALIGFEGTVLTLAGPTGEHHEGMIPVIFAATNYNALNSTVNYMFQMFPTLTPTVIDDTNSALYDGLRINYLGQTQTAGNFISFFQRGDMMGGATAPIACNIYANEAWFKDANEAGFMNLLLALGKVSANTRGISQLSQVIQSNIGSALNNGTISVGKALTTAQQLYITNLSGSNKTWQQVQSIGYWYNVTIEQAVINGITEYKAAYQIIYSKDDAIRSVVGSHILI